MKWTCSHKIIASLFLMLAFCVPAMAQEARPKSATLITNANIFDGQNEKLATGMSVLVEGNKIAKIAKSIPVPSGATVRSRKASGALTSPIGISINKLSVREGVDHEKYP